MTPTKEVAKAARTHRTLTAKEAKALEKRAPLLDREIKGIVVAGHAVAWALAAKMHEFNEERMWEVLGHESLNEWLAQPELSWSRAHFYDMVRMWEQLVVRREVEPDTLAELEPSKVLAVVPAIRRGDVEVDDALSDAEVLGARDIREKYKPSVPGNNDQPLAAEDEPELTQCEACGSWYRPDPDEEQEEA